MKKLKVGDSHFLRDDQRRHDTIIEIDLSRASTIAIKFNHRIVSSILDINHIYLRSYSIKITSNLIEMMSIYSLI